MTWRGEARAFGRGAQVNLARPSLFVGDTAFYYFILAVVTAAVIGVELVRVTRLGRILAAIGDSPEAVQSIGISPTASPSPPTLSVTPRVIDFGTVVDGASADQSFTIMNPGESTLSGTVSTTAPFSVVSGGSFSLAAGAIQSIVVRFSPNGAGGFVTSVNFAWNGGATRRAVIGIGTGIADRDPKTSSARLGRRGSLARGMRSAPSTP